MSLNKAIVLLSGGMDSLAVLAMAIKEHDQIFALHITYGQKTAQKELECFHKISEHYKIPEDRKLIIDLSVLQQIGGSSLTDDKIDVSSFSGDSDEIPSSYVPFRNTHILASAVSWAEVIQANFIYIGANQEDSPGYPDCRVEYYDAYNNLIQKGTKEGVIKIKTPVISLKKEEIIKKIIELNAPVSLTWSCYKNIDKACGECDSCALRLRGFKKLGETDPIDYT